MRALSASLLLLAAAAAAFAADVTVKVIDPQSAAVAGAQVLLLAPGRPTLKTAATSPEGIADFPQLPPGKYRIQVLAPGFGVQTLDFDLSDRADAMIHRRINGNDR